MSLPVTIGMPVYNGAAYLEQALGALLEQTYRNFTLLVSDNASDDGTWEILQDWAARDQRIVLHRQASNIGALANFRYVLDQAETEYFMWHAHDDWLAPNYLAELVGTITAGPDCALACAAVQKIMLDGSVKGVIPGPRLPAGRSRRDRVIDMLRQCRSAWIYGLFRTADLRKAQMAAEEFAYVWAADYVALLYFVLNDRIRGTDHTFLHRRQTKISGKMYRPDTPGKQLSFAWRNLRFHSRALCESNLTVWEKLLCGPWALAYFGRSLGFNNTRRLLLRPAKSFFKAVVSHPLRALKGRR